MRQRLKEKLSTNVPSEMLRQIYNSFDIVGDIAIIKTLSLDNVNAEKVANQIMAIHKGVKTVFAQTSPVIGDYRVRTLSLLGGEDRTETRCKERGCVFSVDLAKCYFSPRLLFERSRLAGVVKKGEIVVNMFAGVGCFSIIIAKTACPTQVYSIDINPEAVKYMEENVKLNRVYGKVTPLLGDSKEIVAAKLRWKADRVLMPLPEKALEYLPDALSALKEGGGWIHFYAFQHAVGNEDPIGKTKQKVAAKLDSLSASYSFGVSRIVRSTGPNWYQTVLDIKVGPLPSKF